jgi:5-methylthioadenosine/S-adenosylhomocysteine deaminase
MPAIPVDLSIQARWIVPMTLRGQVLEEHAVIVQDGRVLDVLPCADARRKYAPAAEALRPVHALLPGLVNADTRAARSLFRGSAALIPPPARSQRLQQLERRYAGSDFVRDGALLSIAQMLKGGTTCFADRHSFPPETAAAAAEQGMRAVIGMPVADAPTAWAQTAAEHLTKALKVRDEYKGHPLISTCFAPLTALLSDATFARIATLAAELDAGVCIDLHDSAGAIAQSRARFGLRPIERLESFGLLTPSLTAVHMVCVDEADIARAQRGGVAVCLCPEADLRRGNGPPPIAALAAAGLRLCLGSGGAQGDQSPWNAVKLTALLSRTGAGAADPLGCWDVLAAATRGGASALGLEGEIGTLEAGKWADLCCVDLSAPAMQPVFEPLDPLVFSGSRDMVTDVWIAGRQLLAGSQLTRLDWPGVAARADAWARRIIAEG